MEHYFEKEDIVARKTHQCEWCLKDIKKGTKYTKQSSIVDGQWFIFKSHRLCFYVSIEANRYDDLWCNYPDTQLQESEIKDLLKAVKKDLKRSKELSRRPISKYNL